MRCGGYLGSIGKQWWSEFESSLGQLIRSLVVAGGAAGFAVHETILAEADFEGGLAEAAVLVAFAAVFRSLALSATVLG